MTIINALLAPLQRLLDARAARLARLEDERRTELQFARAMRTRALPGSTDFYYYNGIVKRLGGV